MSDIWVPLRAGTDILFLGGLIHYALENNKYFREYIAHYTNAPMIIKEEFRDTEDLGGVFSGWDEKKKAYSPETWFYRARKRRMPLGHTQATLPQEEAMARTAAAKRRTLIKMNTRLIQHCSTLVASSRFCAGISLAIPPN